PEMKTIGLVTRTMIDEASGEELAVVYVPTSPNPASGLIQIVSLAKVISTKCGCRAGKEGRGPIPRTFHSLPIQSYLRS
ncbi:MAG: DUF502 domain-containing protein, partial [Gammaproteobacteria bacterium]